MSLSDVICFTPGATGLDKEKQESVRARAQVMDCCQLNEKPDCFSSL